LEFPLDWFSPEISVVPEKRSVQLTFLKGAGTMEAMLRPQSFIRRFSGSSSRADALNPDTSMLQGSLSNSPKPSVSTNNSNLSALGPSPNRVQQLAKQAESFQYLKIEFTRDDKAGVDDNYHRFIDKVRGRLKARSFSRTWTITEDETTGSWKLSKYLLKRFRNKISVHPQTPFRSHLIGLHKQYE